jgi:hypothetical protein
MDALPYLALLLVALSGLGTVWQERRLRRVVWAAYVAWRVPARLPQPEPSVLMPVTPIPLRLVSDTDDEEEVE